MIIIGAGGFAKEVLEVVYSSGEESIVFFDDLSNELPDLIFNQFNVLRSLEEVENYFLKDNRFVLGIGNPEIRKILYDKFINLGGEICSVISSESSIGSFGNSLGEGIYIGAGTVITNGISIGKGTLINLNCTIGHDCVINPFVEVCPGTNISGNVYIGEGSFIGTNVTIYPNIRIGKNCVVAAGSVLTKDVSENSMVAGSPAEFKKGVIGKF